MNINADTGDVTYGRTISHLQTKDKPSYLDLKVQNELLIIQAKYQENRINELEKALGDASKEVCDLNNELNSIIYQLQEME